MDTLRKAKEAEELGSDRNENEDMKILKDSVAKLLTKLEPQAKPTVAVVGEGLGSLKSCY